MRRRDGLALFTSIFSAASCGEYADDEAYASFTLLADLAPGDLAVIDGIPVRVPEPGLGLHTETILEDGATRELELVTDRTGAVYQDVGPLESARRFELHGSPPPHPCRDGAYRVLAHRWTEPLRWRFHDGSTPSGLATDAVELELRRGSNNITASRNDCGLDDQVGAQHVYEGRIRAGVNISSEGSCGQIDGRNVVGFGSLPSGVLGVTCTWYDGASHAAVESDIRLNRGSRWYTSRPSGCTNRFGIQTVMTHERGHSFGLGHVSEHTHGNLTMSTRTLACSDAARTLGLGDVRALREKY